MTDRRSLNRWSWLSASGPVVAGVVVTAMLTAGGAAAEKKTEAAKPAASAKKDDADKKPPLGQITVLVPKKEFKTEGPAKALRVSYDDIDIEKVLNTKTLTLDLPGKMPDWQQKLDGKRVRLMGFINPNSVFENDNVRRFVLCRDTSACCFGPNPTVFYLVEVTMKSGTSTKFTDKRVDIEGVFHIKPQELEGTKEIDRFYSLDDAVVIKH